MADYTPLDADDVVIPAGQSQAPAAAPQASPQNAPQAAPTLMDHDDEVIPVAPGAQAQPQFTTQDQIDQHLQKLLADPKVSGQAIRDFYTSLGGKLSEHDSAIIDGRDAYIAKNHAAPTIGMQDQVDASTNAASGLVDNRPFSFMQGVREGDQHVLSNIAGGIGYLGNKIGLTNDLAGDARRYFANADAADQTQGTDAGKLVGNIAAAAPAGLVAAPIAAVGGGGAVATGLGMLADGALQGALTTNSTTPGGVARDAGTGGVLSLGLGSAANALGRLASRPTAAAVAGRDVLNATDNLSRDGLRLAPLPAETGGMLARGVHAGAESGLLSNPIVRHQIDANLTSAAAIRDRAAMGLAGGAPVRTLDQAGDAALNDAGGLGSYEQRSAEQGGRLYDHAAQLAGNTQIEAPRTLAAVNGLIAQAERTPGNSPGLAALHSLRDDLTPSDDEAVPTGLLDQNGNPITRTVPGERAAFAIDNLRRLRTSFGDNFDANQRAARDAANTLWGPLSEDIQAGLRGAGRGDAADAYQAADRNWAQRQQNLDELVNPLLGSRSEPQLGSKMRAMANSGSGDPDTLNRALALASPDVAGHAHAAIISSLGRDSVGRFSPATFAREWHGLADSYKATLPVQTRQDLDDLATWSGANRDSGSLVNSSKSGRAIAALASLNKAGEGLVMGAPFVHALALPAIGAAAADTATGFAAASPTVARGLVKLGEVRPVSKISALLAKIGQHTAPTIQNQ